MAKHLARGNKVEVWDVNEKKKEAMEAGVDFVAFEKVAKNPIVILAVPMESIEDVLGKLSGLLSKGALVIDVCSLKGFVCKLMNESLPADVEILGMHPLFGPQSTKFGITGGKIAFCPVRVSELALSESKKFCESLGLKVFLTTPEEHDKQMAASQALTHFIGQAMHCSGIKRVELSTKTFDSLMDIADIIKNDSPELFKNMQELNPFALETRRRFLNSLNKIEESLK